MKIRVLILLGMAFMLVVSPVYAKGKGKNKGKSLPPGLAKKYEQGKPLPPGWKKKIAPGRRLDREVYAHRKIIVPADPLGIVTIKIDDKIMKVHEKSMEILEILTR